MAGWGPSDEGVGGITGAAGSMGAVNGAGEEVGSEVIGELMSMGGVGGGGRTSSPGIGI